MLRNLDRRGHDRRIGQRSVGRLALLDCISADIWRWRNHGHRHLSHLPVHAQGFRWSRPCIRPICKQVSNLCIGFRQIQSGSIRDSLPHRLIAGDLYRLRMPQGCTSASPCLPTVRASQVLGARQFVSREVNHIMGRRRPERYGLNSVQWQHYHPRQSSDFEQHCQNHAAKWE
jgi:hypothetical protein